MTTSSFRRIFVPLDGPERSGLAKLAEQELRDPRDQARHIIRCELERRGLLRTNDRRSGAQAKSELERSYDE